MLSSPQILDVPPQPAAVIRLTIPCNEMMTAFGPAVGELMSVLAAQGVEPVGAVFAHHFRMPTDSFDFELGVKVTAPVAPAGRVKPGELPAAKIVRTLYTGPYEGLGDAWSDFMDQIEAAGHQAAPNLWERYITDPNKTQDDSKFETELNRPIL